MAGPYDSEDLLIPTEDFDSSPGFLTPLRIGLIIGALGLVVSLGLAWFQLRPMIQRISEVETDISNKETRLSAARRRISELEGVETRIVDARRVSEAVSTLLPTPANLETQLLELTRLINLSLSDGDGTAELRSFTPTVPVPAGAEVPEAIQAQILRSTAEIDFQGTYAEMVRLMETIEQLETLLQVRNVSLNTQIDEAGMVLPVLNASFQLEIFVYDSTFVPPEPEEGTEEAAPAEAGSEPTSS